MGTEKMESALIGAAAAIVGILLGFFFKSLSGETGSTVAKTSLEAAEKAIGMYSELQTKYVELAGRVEALETEKTEMLEKIEKQAIEITELRKENTSLREQINRKGLARK